MARSVSWRRRLLLPLLILIVGGALAIWAAQRESGRIEAIERLATDLCRSAAAGSDLTHRLLTADPLLDGQLAPTLERICEPLKNNPQSLEVIASSGDAPGFSDGSATHHAIIRIAGAERLTLRLVFEDDEVLIVGYALPPTPDPSPP
jgi:hypothetical protein